MREVENLPHIANFTQQITASHFVHISKNVEHTELIIQIKKQINLH